MYNTKKSGSIFLDVIITPLIESEENNIRDYLVQVIDITESKQSEEELRQCAVTFELIEKLPSVAIVKVNKKIEAEYVSPSIKKFLGYSP